AFLEEWCEEQQDILDRSAGPAAYEYEIEPPPAAARRAVLRVVDLRDEVVAGLAGESGADGGTDDDDSDGHDHDHGGSATIIAVVETEHDRKVRQIRARLDRLRTRVTTSAIASAALRMERRR
ncbi:MAG: hypothetical protein QOD57_3252, partial [Actinomycetota bacterium]|nr:hypothetical protein [Actinomycetota bacterium]